MKKIAIILLTILSFQLCALSQSLETDINPIEIQVYSEDGKFGLKTKDGKQITPPEYKKMIILGDKAWITQYKNRFGIMGADGNWLVQPKYRHADRVLGKYAKLGNDRDYGIYDENGNTIIPPEYSSIELLLGGAFVTCKNYKYGIIDFNGNKLLDNEFEDIYMPTPKILRIKSDGDWFEIEKVANQDIELPDNERQITINDNSFKITYLLTNTGIASGYSVVTATDYLLKLIASISPAYEETIDELMLSQGAETVSIFMKLGWLPKFPFTYAKKYYTILKNPNNGPLNEVKSNLKKRL